MESPTGLSDGSAPGAGPSRKVLPPRIFASPSASTSMMTSSQYFLFSVQPEKNIMKMKRTLLRSHAIQRRIWLHQVMITNQAVCVPNFAFLSVSFVQRFELKTRNADAVFWEIKVRNITDTWIPE